MKRKPIIFITSILLLIGGYLFFKTSNKKNVEAKSFTMKTKTKIVIQESPIDSIFRKYNFASGKYERVNFEYTPKEIVVGELVSFKSLTANAKSWEWRFGESDDLSVDSKEKNPTYTYKKAGLKKITLVVNKNYTNCKTIAIFSKYPEPPLCCYPCENRSGNKKPKLILNEDLLKRALIGISRNELSYRNFAKYFFCKHSMPIVHLSDSIITLRELCESIQNKPIKINKAKLKKDKDECITDLYIDYQLLK